MVYEITNYTKNRAMVLGVIVKPSTNPNYKIDVYKNGVKLVSIGDSEETDYPSYIRLFGLEFANKKKWMYKHRRFRDIEVVDTKEWYTYKLLW